jgi:HD-GYP domain-containing protein (c-di-GMP phosphodiesterase class II)
MNTIDTKTLKSGNTYTEPVFITEGYMLTPARIPLRQKDIDFLVTWNIDTVITEGIIVSDEIIEEIKEEIITDPDPLPFEMDLGQNEETGIIDFNPFQLDELELDDVETIKDSTKSSSDKIVPVLKEKFVKFSISDVEEKSAPYRAYITLIDKLDTVFIAISKGIDIEMSPINNVCNKLIQELRTYRNNFIDYILGGEVTGHELAKSSVNTAILSALTAQELKLPNYKIMHIVTGALLHDTGMLRMSKDIINKKGGLSDAEHNLIKNHPVYTSKIVTKELFCSVEVNYIALQHHERWDGIGYPEKLAGKDIYLGARIVSVAAAFEAMVSKKSYRGSMLGYEAMKNLLADNSRRFDPEVISAFTRVMGIYPIGSIILLNNGLLARVIYSHPNAPLRPKIHMLTDETGAVLKPDEGEIIDLLNIKKLYIKNAIDPEELAGANV